MPSPEASETSVVRVAIDALSQGVGGGVSVARHVTRSMAEQRPRARFELFCSAEALAVSDFPGNVTVHHLPALAGFARRMAWEQRVLPQLLREGRFEVLSNLGGFAVLRCPVPQVSVWQNANTWTRVPIPRPRSLAAYIAVQRVVQGVSMRRADLNVFPTRDALAEAGTRWDMRRIPHTVIPYGVEAFRAAPASSEDSEGGPILLSVGDIYYHKNYEGLIDGLARYRERFGDTPPLVIAGGAIDAGYHEALEQRARRRGLGDRVRFVGRRSPEDVAALYRRTRVYLVTSLLESFGLTPLEAMAAGVPVVAGRASSLPEVCGDAAHYCDPRDPDDLARKLRDVLDDEALRADLVRRGRERAASFDWASCGRMHLAALDACAKGRRLGAGSPETPADALRADSGGAP